MATAASNDGETEVAILGRLLIREDAELPAVLARYILGLTLSDRDKSRMHDLAVRSQDDALTPAERDEMLAFGKAATLLSILKSRARRTLGTELKSAGSS